MIAIIIIIFPYVSGNSLTYVIIVEIWIAIGIAMIVYHFSKKTEEDNERTLNAIEKMIRYQFVENQWVRNEARFKVIHDFNKILEISRNIIENAEKWEKETQQKERDKLKIKILSDYAEFCSDAIKNLTSKKVITTAFFSFYEIQHIEMIVEECKLEITFDEQKHVCNYYHLNTIQTFLPKTIKKYEEEMSSGF